MVTNEAKITALIYAAGNKGITLTDLANQAQISPAACRQLVAKLTEQYAKDQQSGLEIQVTDETYRLATKAEVADVVNDYIWHSQPQNLSTAAIEIIAIIAYNQPIARVEIDDIRGVNSSATLRHLQELELVEVVGEKKEIGHPKLYGISNYGLNYFGLKSQNDLPQLPEATSEL